MLWTWDKTKETNKTVLGIPGSGIKCGKVIIPTVQDGYRSDPGGVIIPYII